jgi:hypothetical protein
LVNNPQAVPFITDKFKFPAAVIYQWFFSSWILLVLLD